MARNLSGRDENHSINENDRWVFDDSGCNILEEAGLRRSISRQIQLSVYTDGFSRAKPGRVRVELRMEECEGSHTQVIPTLTAVCWNNSSFQSPKNAFCCSSSVCCWTVYFIDILKLFFISIQLYYVYSTVYR